MCSRWGVLRLDFVHPRRLEDGQIGLCGDIDDGLVAQVALLAHPEILDIGGGDAAVLYLDGFGGTLGACHFGLGVELLGLEVRTGFLNLNLAVLFGFGKLGLAFHLLRPYVVPGTDECHAYHKDKDGDESPDYLSGNGGVEPGVLFLFI